MLLRWLACIVLSTFLATLPSLAGNEAPDDLGCGLTPGPERTVAAVLDGETVRLDDGKSVRLIGALAPRSIDVGSSEPWPPEVSAREALRALAHGRTVQLAFAGRREDRYGRVLAHLFIVDGAERRWLQGRMIEDGHARAYGLPDSSACLGQLILRERQAREASRGLWGNTAYQPRPAQRPTELSRYAATFQIVIGRVLRTSRSSQRIFLDFESDEAPRGAADGETQRGAFRASWPRALRALPGAQKPDDLVGKSVLVRGWIGVRGGPIIDLTTEGQIELID